MMKISGHLLRLLSWALPAMEDKIHVVLQGNHAYVGTLTEVKVGVKIKKEKHKR